MMFRKCVISVASVLTLVSCTQEQDSVRYEERVRPSLVEMDLSKAPSHKDLIAAGQLGGLLSPTEEVELETGFIDKMNPFGDEEERLAFGQAIQAWNQHQYKEASADFARFAQKYPDSP